MDKKTNNIFFHKIFKAIADSTIKIFIPLYILKATGDLWLSIIYLIAQSLCVLIFMFALKKLLHHHGLLCIILHCIPIIITQALISFCYLSWLVVVLCGIFMSLGQTLYSIPLNILFAKVDKKTNVAKFQIASNVGKLCFILLSGIILSKIPNSFLYLSLLASLFYILSILPISLDYTRLKNKLKQPSRAIKTSYENISQQPQNTNSSTSTKRAYTPSPWFRTFHVCFGLFQVTIDNILPLYLYINNLSFEAVTTTIAVVELLKILSNYLANYLVYKKHFISCAVISFITYITSLIGLILIKNTVVLYILSCTISISFPLCFVPMFKLFCNRSSKNNCISQQMFIRDVDIFAGRPLYYASFFLANTLLPCMLLAFPIVFISFLSQVKLYKKSFRKYKSRKAKTAWK